MEVEEENEEAIYASLEASEIVELNADSNSKPLYTAVDNTSEKSDISEKKVAKSSAAIGRRKKKFTCLICNKKFSQNAGRYNHMRKIHNVTSGESANNIKCLEKGCDYTCSYKEKLQMHLSVVHGIDMDVTIKTFDGIQDFLRWKDEFERQEKSRFVKKSGSRIREEGIRVGYYYCSRSGTYVSHSKGMKNSKKIGTSKSNNHCTASITCVELPSGKMEVKICSTHYGHESELQHLRLTQTEKFQIAEQLVQGVPRELVLDNVRASTGSDVDRIHLITIKDVKNIEKAYGIQANPNQKTNDIFYNLSIWLANIQASEHCPVLYFQEEGTHNTKSHNITLILMTTGQLEVFNKFAKSGIYYVTMFEARNKPSSYCQNMNASLLHVTTLMLVDDLNEAVPVCFLITNSSDPYKLVTFFETIKKKVPEISAKAVLTDNRKDVYDIWCTVFEEKPYHLWSNRYIDNDWRENLICISDEEVQVSIYEKLYSFLESPDRDKLESTLESYIYQLQSNVVTKKFGDYFAPRYFGNEYLWAGCYGKQIVGVSAQLNMEITCNEVEEIGSRKNSDKNFFVRNIQNLLKLVSEKQCIRQSKQQRQIQELPTHHKLGLNVKTEAISQESDNSWRVNSVKDPTNIFSNVSIRDVKCQSTTCVLYCTKCNVCAHQFQCSCKVHAYDRTMCKHIHAVALKFFKPKTEENCEVVNSNKLSQIQEVEEKEVNNPELISLNESMWRKITVRPPVRKKKSSVPTREEDLLPVINEILSNKHITPKRKRGRPKKPKKHSQENETNGENLKRANTSSDNNTTNANQRRINILRKNKK